MFNLRNLLDKIFKIKQIDIEIRNLKKNILKYQHQLEDVHCEECEYFNCIKLKQKIERCNKQLIILQNRKIKQI